MPRDFETAVKELESITAQLEQGDVPLDEVATIYGRGAELIKFCRERLQAARGTIQKLEKNALSEMEDVE